MPDQCNLRPRWRGRRDIYGDGRTVDMHIGRLRKAVNRFREKNPIRTVRGAGYAIDDMLALSA